MLCSRCGADVNGKLYCENCGARTSTIKQKNESTSATRNVNYNNKKTERKTKILSFITAFKSSVK